LKDLSERKILAQLKKKATSNRTGAKGGRESCTGEISSEKPTRFGEKKFQKGDAYGLPGSLTAGVRAEKEGEKKDVLSEKRRNRP